MNWLIAEDEADIRNLVTMMCTVWGHTPITFENGQKVWDWMDKIEAGELKGPLPELALMDIRMPGKRGNELALRMRSVDALKNVPIVLMTAFALGEEEINRMKVDFGIDHIINKPLPDFDKLRTTLHDIIKRKAQQVAEGVITVPAAASLPTVVNKPVDTGILGIASPAADAAPKPDAADTPPNHSPLN
ncbi:MAG: response regulator [Armatimonadetes bacterium]|nr:response regulator [Anaerolineae bacterium]